MSEPARPKTPVEALETVTEKVSKANGDVVIKKYSKGRLLGKGGFSRVYDFTALDSKRSFAGKVIPKAALTKSRAKQKLMSEIKIHRSLNHPNIVHFSHFFEDQENVYLLIELCPNQTMSELLRRRKRLMELEVQSYGIQTIDALTYLHEHRVIHRDLKLGNLFISEKMEIKLGDFGLAAKVEFDGERKRTICGTPNYIAPEVLDGKSGHSFEVDIWSLGVVLYTLLIGKPPFETSDVRATYKRIKMNAYSFPEHVPISSAAKSLITRILHSEPSKRPTLDEIRAHEFFHQGYSIPKTLPPSTLAVPPSRGFLDQYRVPICAQLAKPTADTAPALKLDTCDRLLTSAPHTSRPSTQRPITPVLRSESPVPEPRKRSTQPVADLTVLKWVDYTNKYGLGYLLSNNSIGVYFNDSSKIVLNPSSGAFEYVDRKSATDTPVRYSLKNHPEELRKKVTLLQHFAGQLTKGVSLSPCTAEPPLLYVKRFLVSEEVMTFRLSNRMVQLTFPDNCVMLIDSGTKTVVINEQLGGRVVYPLGYAIETREEPVFKRMKVAKEVIAKLVPVNDGRVTLRESNR